MHSAFQVCILDSIKHTYKEHYWDNWGDMNINCILYNDMVAMLNSLSVMIALHYINILIFRTYVWKYLGIKCHDVCK